MDKQREQTLFRHRDADKWGPVAGTPEQGSDVEALRTLAGGIAHNFNNLNMGIQGNTSLMLFETDAHDPNYERLKTIEALVRRGSILISQLLGYAGEGRCRVRPIALNRLAKETLKTFGKTEKPIRVQLELAEDLFKIEADENQIAQVLLNLYANAADAMSRGGDLYVRTMNVTHKEMAGKAYKPRPGKYVVFIVTDTGTGMDKETMARIFEPFFSTKPVGQGMGLGLASVYGIVKAQGGYIDVDSEVGRGTSFKIYLPAHSKGSRCAKELSEKVVVNGKPCVPGNKPMTPQVPRQILSNKVCGRAEGPISVIEASPQQAAGNLHRKDDNSLDIRSLTPQPAKHCRQAEPTGNALAYAAQPGPEVRASRNDSAL
ncbi:MAG: ATP-binding protein [Thermodesulfobacteriota bacterium]|nr:ATP-binding protein [Thermodesulfobacteriota bacterium]